MTSIDRTKSIRRARLGVRGPVVTSVALGTSPLGGMPDSYGYDVAEAQAIATVRAFVASPVNFIDTSNEYTDGESERRIGIAFGEGPVKPDLIIATKADPVRGVRDFSGDRVRQSFAESVARLRVNRVDVFYLHDPERFPFSEVTAPGGALEAAIELRDSGHVTVVGVAGGDIDEMHRYLDTGRLDVLLNHSQYNLLDRSADRLIDHAMEAGVAYVNAAPYASGMLAKPPSSRPHFQYRQPSADVIAKTTWLRTTCEPFGVPLAALALQFSTRDPRITATVVGVSSPERVQELVRNELLDIPQDLWVAVQDGLGRSGIP